jgi:hypothetical protein
MCSLQFKGIGIFITKIMKRLFISVTLKILVIRVVAAGNILSTALVKEARLSCYELTIQMLKLFSKCQSFLFISIFEKKLYMLNQMYFYLKFSDDRRPFTRHQYLFTDKMEKLQI